jgi:hypothetical protein
MDKLHIPVTKTGHQCCNPINSRVKRGIKGLYCHGSQYTLLGLKAATAAVAKPSGGYQN